MKGWIICKEYNYKGKKIDPIGYIDDKGTLRGYMYIYPTKKCAEASIWKLRGWNAKFTIKKVDVNIASQPKEILIDGKRYVHKR